MCMLIPYLGFTDLYACFFLNCLVGCLSILVWTPAVLGVLCISYMHLFCIFVFAPVQHNVSHGKAI